MMERSRGGGRMRKEVVRGGRKDRVIKKESGCDERGKE